MKRFVQKDFWQLNFTEPMSDVLGSEKRTSLRERMMNRLHRVFNKEADATPVLDIQYTGSSCTITVNQYGIYVKATEGTAVYWFTDTTTLTDLVDQLNTYSIFVASLVSSEYSSLLAKGLFDDSIELPAQLQYPKSLLWQEMQTSSFALTDQTERISNATNQLYFHSSDSDWLDLWADYYFSVERYLGETDSDYLSRAIKELMQPTQNNTALEMIVQSAFGMPVKIVDAMPYASELPPPYLPTDARNRFLLDMAIPAEYTTDQATALIDKVKNLVRKYKSAGTDFIEVPLRKYFQPSESISPTEAYHVSISVGMITETLSPGPIKVGAGWKVGTPGLKVGTNDAVKEQANVQLLLSADSSVVAQYLIGG